MDLNYLEINRNEINIEKSSTNRTLQKETQLERNLDNNDLALSGLIN